VNGLAGEEIARHLFPNDDWVHWQAHPDAALSTNGIFGTLAESFRGGTEFSFSDNDSNCDALRFGRQGHEFDAVLKA
jgi:hypothetical protein